MRLVGFFLFVFALSTPAGVQAGAWLRERGTTFSATGISVNYFRDVISTTYIEHGWRDDLTVGLDVGYFTNRFGATSGLATLFIRKPFSRKEGADKWAYEVGAGAGWIGELVLPHVKLGVSWGRGYKLGEKFGWMAVDTSVTYDVTFGETLSKIDTTVGLELTDTTKGIVQLYLTHLNGEIYGVVAPSVVFTPREKKFSIQIGAESPLNNWDNTAIKIGLWRKF